MSKNKHQIQSNDQLEEEQRKAKRMKQPTHINWVSKILDNNNNRAIDSELSSTINISFEGLLYASANHQGYELIKYQTNILAEHLKNNRFFLKDLIVTKVLIGNRDTALYRLGEEEPLEWAIRLCVEESERRSNNQPSKLSIEQLYTLEVLINAELDRQVSQPSQTR